jgi:N-methylhydantoinase B
VSIEVIEADFPIRLKHYGFRTDSGGAGKYRGGVGMEREWEVLSDNVLVSIRADRTKFAPWGLKGGRPGALALNILNPQGDARILPSKTHCRVNKGVRFLHLMPGGGGYGEPLERDPELVFWDWRNQKISAAHARTEYGS